MTRAYPQGRIPSMDDLPRSKQARRRLLGQLAKDERQLHREARRPPAVTIAYLRPYTLHSSGASTGPGSLTRMQVHQPASGPRVLQPPELGQVRRPGEWAATRARLRQEAALASMPAMLRKASSDAAAAATSMQQFAGKFARMQPWPRSR